ncbi:MAG: DUF2252 family protein [Methylosarcina sp.]
MKEGAIKKDTTKKHAHKKGSPPFKIAEPLTVDRRSRADRKDGGKAMRLAVPLESLAEWKAATDIFLGWTENELGSHFYIRQLRDMKIKPLVELLSPSLMNQYAEYCGWALARAHARSGDAAKIAGYLGKKEDFDEALADFAEAYADQNEQDHRALVQAVRESRLEVYLER